MPDNAEIPATPVSTGLKTSDEIGELAKALADAHKDFKPVLKDANNPFFKSKYADLAGVIEATSDALSKNGLAVIQSPRLGLNRIAVTTLLAHSSGQWLRDDLELPLSKFDAQGAGSAITYARRYAYQAIVGVAAEDDDGNAASQKFEKQGDNFVRKTDSPVPTQVSAAVPAQVKAAEPPKPVARRKKESVPDAGKPWGGEFEKPKIDGQGYAINPAVLPANIPQAEPNIHGVVIEDSEIEFPGDPEPKPAEKYVSPLEGKSMVGENPARLATDDERKAFMGRLIKLKDKGFTGIREYLLKESGQTITNEIPFARMQELVARLEVSESEGKLKTLLEAK